MFASRVLSRRATRQLVRTRQFGAQAQEYEGLEKTVRTYLPKDEHVSALYNFTPPHTRLGIFFVQIFPLFLVHNLARAAARLLLLVVLSLRHVLCLYLLAMRWCPPAFSAVFVPLFSEQQTACNENPYISLI